MLEITPIPNIECRTVIGKISKKRKGPVERWYVVGVPSFEGAQLYGFKSEEALMKCYTWWYNNVHLKHQRGKVANKEWIEGGRDKFYGQKQPGCVPKPRQDIEPQEDVEPPANEDDAPPWL
jgi:hypothetical protein